MFDYEATRRELLAGVQQIGRAVTADAAERSAGMSADQLRRFKARNMMTDERWQVRKLAGGAILVEIAYGWFLDKPLFGLTVFCVGELAADAPEWDHTLSGVFGSVSEVIGRLAELNAGGRERIAALAAKG